MNTWRDIEVYCSRCEGWQCSGGAATAVNFESASPAITLTGPFALSCGHTVIADADNVRLKAE
jgi:hypothetical protein